MLALRTLMNFQRYTVTVINRYIIGNPNAYFGQLNYISGNIPRTQSIINLPLTFPFATQTLNFVPDAGTAITWISQPPNIVTDPLQASVLHDAVHTNLNVFIGAATP